MQGAVSKSRRPRLTAGSQHAPEHRRHWRTESEETMHESSIVRYFTEKAVQQGIEQGIERGIQQGIERGIQQGKRETALESLIGVLEVRFHTAGVQTLKPALEAIEDSQRLQQLLYTAVQVLTLEEFAANLVSSGHGTS